MGSTQRNVFCRPIEITAENNSINILYDPGGGVQANAIGLTTGVYGSVNQALWHLNSEIRATAYAGGGGSTFADLSFEITIDTDCKVNIACGSSIAINWTDTDLAAWLGFETNLSSGTSFTADWTPSHMWLSTYVNSDQDYWTIAQRERFGGAKSNSGRIAGNALHDRRYVRDFEFRAEPAANCMIAFEDDAYTLTSTYYPQADRCFEYFIEQCRTSVSSGTNQYSKGIYVFHSVTAFQTLNETMGDGGVKINLASGADDYVYCSPMVGGSNVGNAFFPVGRDRYNIGSFFLETASAPDWDAN